MDNSTLLHLLIVSLVHNVGLFILYRHYKKFSDKWVKTYRDLYHEAIGYKSDK